jgi:hypothetical protein
MIIHQQDADCHKVFRFWAEEHLPGETTFKIAWYYCDSNTGNPVFSIAN